MIFYCRLNDISLFRQVVSHPEYKARPLEAIQEHLTMTLQHEESMESWHLNAICHDKLRNVEQLKNCEVGRKS